MPEFRFHAPALIEAGAAAESPFDRFHGAPAVADANAHYKRFAHWLAGKLSARGHRVQGPEPDEEGWILAIPSNGAAAQLVICCALGGPGEIVRDCLLPGPADPASAAACEAILRSAPEIGQLCVRG